MSTQDRIDPQEVADFLAKVEDGMQRGVPADEMMEIMLVHHVMTKARGKNITTMTDGKNTVQCVINNPKREKPRKT